jgi:hypothetical protein
VPGCRSLSGKPRDGTSPGGHCRKSTETHGRPVAELNVLGTAAGGSATLAGAGKVESFDCGGLRCDTSRCFGLCTQRPFPGAGHQDHRACTRSGIQQPASSTPKLGNLKLAQKLLGHATIDMTANVYTHTDAEAERTAALALERAIYGDLFVIVREMQNKNSQTAPKLGLVENEIFLATARRKGRFRV